ncbi:hypothetical protein B0H10DRAFT_577477 [Mycena sp. CBHHK59/15]|nr:hypothetical protein B0H10DRAFT_577477 [Mycena sp. CBHHK59/15]
MWSSFGFTLLLLPLAGLDSTMCLVSLSFTFFCSLCDSWITITTGANSKEESESYQHMISSYVHFVHRDSSGSWYHDSICLTCPGRMKLQSDWHDANNSFNKCGYAYGFNVAVHSF